MHTPDDASVIEERFVRNAPFNYPGLVFPFFSNSVGGDISGIIQCLHVVFAPFMGKSSDAASMIFKLSQDLEGIVSSLAGQEVSHMAWGILQAANKSCLIQMIISNGTYNGFVLYQQGIFAVNAEGTTFQCQPAPVVAQEILSLTTHNVALDKLVVLLSGMILNADENTDASVEVGDNEFREEIDDGSLYSPRATWTEIQKRTKQMTPSQRAEVKSLVATLRFEAEDYLEFTAENIAVLAHHIAEEEYPSDDAPMYLDASNCLEGGYVVALLSSFGPTAPSFLIAQGRKVPIPSRDQDDWARKMINVQRVVKKEIITERVAKFSHMYAERKKILQAAEDWAEIRHGGYVLQPEAKLTRKESSRYRVFEGELMLDFWTKLRPLAKGVEEEPAVVAGQGEAPKIGGVSMDLVTAFDF